MIGKDPNYSSPYGDLSEEPRAQHSTFEYDDGVNTNIPVKEANLEESRGLIKPTNGSNFRDNESDLAMAVVDILSCCDERINQNQAKLLLDMELRYQDNGNLNTNLDDEEGHTEKFSDEPLDKVTSFFRKIFPASTKPKDKLLRDFQRSNSNVIKNRSSNIHSFKNRYAVRSSSGMTGQLPVKSETRTTSQKDITYPVWKKLCVSAFAAIAVAATVVVVFTLTYDSVSSGSADTESRNPNLSIMTPITSDCAEVSKQAHPHVLSQCACHASITYVSEAAQQKYHSLLNAFGAEYLHSNETMSSCSSRNQALVWLAEDEGSTLNSALIQRHTLALFFIKLNGPRWTLAADKQAWLTSDHECTWYGIACNGDNEVISIDLWNLNLEGPIPKEIMSLTSLQTLSLPENRIKGHLPTDAFVMLPKLSDLTLFMNSLSGSIDGRILDRITMLRTLNLDSNNLTGTIPTDIGKLSALEELKLARNNLKGSLPSELGNLKVLQKVEIEENNLDGTLPSEMGRLYLLKSLNLSWNSFQGSLPWEFENLRHLVDLFLKNNNFSGKLPEVIKVMDKLENLALSFNAFTGELPSGMEHMVSLTNVHLDENRFNGTLPSALGACTMLRDLKLEYNNFHGSIPTQLGRLEWLISLSIEGNSFSGEMPQEVCSLRSKTGMLDSLSATCTATVDAGREKEGELFVRPDEFICAVPACCTSCRPKG